MTEALIALVPAYGLLLLAVITALSCFGLPVPSSILMILAGSLAASGDLSLVSVLAVTLCSAIVADQAGFLLGHFAGGRLLAWLGARGERKALVDRARAFTLRNGAASIYLTRWLFSPLGPYVNLITGALGYPWLRFLLWGSLGEATWVSLYVGLGYLFSAHVLAVIDIAGNASGLLAAAALTAFFGWRLFRAPKKA